MGEPQSSNGRLRVSFSILAQIAGWIVGALLLYSAMNARVAVTEDRVQRLTSDVQEIKADVKALLQRKP